MITKGLIQLAYKIGQEIIMMDPVGKLQGPMVGKIEKIDMGTQTLFVRTPDEKRILEVKTYNTTLIAELGWLYQKDYFETYVGLFSDVIKP